MLKKRCPRCGSKNTKKHDIRSRQRFSSLGKTRTTFHRWWCHECKKPFTPKRKARIEKSLIYRLCELYFDAEASYRACSRQLGLSAYKLFLILNKFGENCKTPVEVARELKPRWSGYLVLDEKSIYVKGRECFLLLAIDIGTFDIIHFDLVEIEDDSTIEQFILVIRDIIKYPFKGVVSDLLPSFIGVLRRVLHGIPHQYCTRHYYSSTEFYIKYRYTGRNKYWSENLLKIVHIIAYTKSYTVALRALNYLLRNEAQFRDARLTKRTNLLRKRFPNLTKHFLHPGMPRDNNIAETVIRQLNRKLKTMDGYQRTDTAYNSLKLLVMHYRFKKFSCSRDKARNGKSPLELAGINTSNLNWIKYSQRTNASKLR